VPLRSRFVNLTVAGELLSLTSWPRLREKTRGQVSLQTPALINRIKINKSFDKLENAVDGSVRAFSKVFPLTCLEEL
jgi:hypothetical protein